MPLDQKIAKFIEKERLMPLGARVLVAVSGGKDSMALLQILQSMKYEVGAAHINYKLRGTDSDKDEALVESFCHTLKVSFFSYSVSQEESQQLQNNNLQEEARNIRYRFFEKICTTSGYDYIATAHHKNDQVETLILNLLRGSGINGLKAMPSKRNKIVRPLLEISRKEIEDHVEQYKIPFRHDASNHESKYNRNYIRNEVIPILTSRWPAVIDTINHSVSHLTDENKLLQHLIAAEKSRWIHSEGSTTKFGPISKIRKIPSAKSLSRMLLQDYKIKENQLQHILDSKTSVGADFSNLDFQIFLDRDYLIISTYKQLIIDPFLIEEDGDHTTPCGTISIHPKSEFQDYKNRDNPDIEYLDASKVAFPLSLTSIHKGDRWQPLGLKGSKLVSDSLTDKKIDQIKKQSIVVLKDQNQKIIWISDVGISDKVKIANSTTKALAISWKSIF